MIITLRHFYLWNCSKSMKGKDYPEQLICLEKIKKYEQGFRYNPNDYLKIY